MQKRLWNHFSLLFIRTPIAAIIIIIGMVSGLFIWMNSIHIQNYYTVTGTSIKTEKSTLVRVQGDFNVSQLHNEHKITWYLNKSGERYEGTVANILRNQSESIVEIEINGISSVVHPVYIDIPQGTQTVWSKIIRKGDSQ